MIYKEISSGRPQSAIGSANHRNTTSTSDPQNEKTFAKMHRNLLTSLTEQFKDLSATASLSLGEHVFWQLDCWNQVTSSRFSGPKLIPTLKSLEYLMKLILSSRTLYDKLQLQDAELSYDKPTLVLTVCMCCLSYHCGVIYSHRKEEFKKDMITFFDTFNELMASQKADLARIQALAIKQFSKYFRPAWLT